MSYLPVGADAATLSPNVALKSGTTLSSRVISTPTYSAPTIDTSKIVAPTLSSPTVSPQVQTPSISPAIKDLQASYGGIQTPAVYSNFEVPDIGGSRTWSETAPITGGGIMPSDDGLLIPAEDDGGIVEDGSIAQENYGSMSRMSSGGQATAYTAPVAPTKPKIPTVFLVGGAALALYLLLRK